MESLRIEEDARVFHVVALSVHKHLLEVGKDGVQGGVLQVVQSCLVDQRSALADPNMEGC